MQKGSHVNEDSQWHKKIPRRAWLWCLFQLVVFISQNKDTCQPEQAIEPSAVGISEETDDIKEASASSNGSQEDFYVPVPSKKRQTKKEQQFT